MTPRFTAILLIGALLVGCKSGSEEAASSHAGHEAPAAPVASAEGHTNHAAPPESVQLSPEQAQLANVATAKVVARPFRSTVTASGRITYDESRLARVTAWVDGRIQNLRVSTTGAIIRKGQPIADIYSPDLVSTQQELLLAVQSAKALSGSSVPGIREDAERLVDASRQRLRLWGLTDAQINQVILHGKPVMTMPVLSPASGVVLKRMVQPGDWVDKGMVLFEVADLSRVWVEADVYEYELGAIRPGASVQVSAVAYPGDVFHGRVAFVQPVMNAETRTNSVRIELPNPGGRLKPDMFVSATLTSDQGKRVVVPADAVVDTGKRQLVWVETDPGQFTSREVRVGAQSDDGYEILSGLRPGETIAVSGGFMIDASSQLTRGGASGHTGHGASKPKPQANEGTNEPSGHAHD